MPDASSLTHLPWQPEIARFACDVTVEGEEWPFCPRTILRNQLARARRSWATTSRWAASWSTSSCAAARTAGSSSPTRSTTLDQPCYDMRALTRSLGFVTDVARHVNALGWDIYATDHEDANGQFEQNFQFDDALVTCDRAIFFRYMVESLAQERGLIATFMPKPFAHLTGNGCHMHMSLWDGDRNVFDADPADDPRGLGLTKEGYHFIGGLMAHAKAYIAVTAPTVNSYKRLKVGDPRSGATWAPVYVSYGYNNRTQMLRVPAPGPRRGPHRRRLLQPLPGAPTVLLAAGPRRDRARARPGRPEHRSTCTRRRREQRQELGIDTLPENLLDATRELERDDVIRAALGTHARRRLRRLLRRVQAPRGAGRARADHAVGAQPLPAALLADVRDRRTVRQGAGRRGAARRALGAMLGQMADRGPDSAGLALYRDPAPPGATKLSLFSPTRTRTGRRSATRAAREPTSPCARRTRC